MGYDSSGFKLWKKIEGLDELFFHMCDDVHAEEIAKHCLANKVVGHIFIEHNVDDNLSMVLKPNLKNVSQGSDDGSNYYEVIRIMFDNSEQEIMDEKWRACGSCSG